MGNNNSRRGRIAVLDAARDEGIKGMNAVGFVSQTTVNEKRRSGAVGYEESSSRTIGSIVGIAERVKCPVCCKKFRRVSFSDHFQKCFDVGPIDVTRYSSK